MIIIVLGVAGSGKTTVGEMLALKHGWSFIEGDDLRALHRGPGGFPGLHAVLSTCRLP